MEREAKVKVKRDVPGWIDWQLSRAKIQRRQLRIGRELGRRGSWSTAALLEFCLMIYGEELQSCCAMDFLLVTSNTLVGSIGLHQCN